MFEEDENKSWESVLEFIAWVVIFLIICFGIPFSAAVFKATVERHNIVEAGAKK